MNLNWKLVAVIALIVTSFTVLAFRGTLDKTLIATIVSSLVTYGIGLATNPKKLEPSNGQQ